MGVWFGSRTTIVNNALATSGNVSYIFAPLSRSDELSNAGNIATENLTIIDGTYPHIDVYIDGTKLEERVTNPLYTVSSISGDTNNSYINFANVQALPGGNIAADAKIVVDERATIDFVEHTPKVTYLEQVLILKLRKMPSGKTTTNKNIWYYTQ